MAYLYTLQNTIFQRSPFCSLRSRWWRQSRESGVAKMVTLRSRIVAKASAFYVVAQRAGSCTIYNRSNRRREAKG